MQASMCCKAAPTHTRTGPRQRQETPESQQANVGWEELGSWERSSFPKTKTKTRPKVEWRKPDGTGSNTNSDTRSVEKTPFTRAVVNSSWRLGLKLVLSVKISGIPAGASIVIGQKKENPGRWWIPPPK
ncbi:hypothetical protein B0H13DRAFT_1862042 [Mycena leptocephala]|nr:hypothetical protein B0H13DRAFT_1862042 [Mycena leptocephala]